LAIASDQSRVNSSFGKLRASFYRNRQAILRTVFRYQRKKGAFSLHLSSWAIVGQTKNQWFQRLLRKMSELLDKAVMLLSQGVGNTTGNVFIDDQALLLQKLMSKKLGLINDDRGCNERAGHNSPITQQHGVAIALEFKISPFRRNSTKISQAKYTASLDVGFIPYFYIEADIVCDRSQRLRDENKIKFMKPLGSTHHQNWLR
jgi:hypothetical protein